MTLAKISLYCILKQGIGDSEPCYHCLCLEEERGDRNNVIPHKTT